MRVGFRRRYTKPVEKVWAALTTPERLEDWLGAAKVDLRVGGKLHLSFGNGGSARTSINCGWAPPFPGRGLITCGPKTSGFVAPWPRRDGGRPPPEHSRP